MKKSTITSVFCIALSIILVVVVFFKKGNSKNIDLLRENILLKNYVEVEKSDFKISFDNLGRKIDSTIFLMNESGDSIPINDIINHYSFIVYFHSMACESCIEKVFKFIERLTQNGKIDIAIFKTIHNSKEITEFIENNDCKLPIFGVAEQKVGLPAENYLKAFLFGVNKELKTTIFYSLEEKNEEFWEYYIDWSNRVLSVN
jgi:hypothetical protein